MKKKYYLGDGLALTKKEFMKARRRFYKLAVKHKLKKLRRVL